MFAWVTVKSLSKTVASDLISAALKAFRLIAAPFLIEVYALELVADSATALNCSDLETFAC